MCNSIPTWKLKILASAVDCQIITVLLDSSVCKAYKYKISDLWKMKWCFQKHI